MIAIAVCGCASSEDTAVGGGGHDGAPDGLDAYSFRAPIEVTGEALVSVAVAFDHADLVGAGKSLATGDDVRVVFAAAGADPVEIHRMLDPVSSWDVAATKLWFRIQADAGDYYLYYGQPAAASPLADGSAVFHLWDDFDGGELQVDWRFDQVGAAEGAVELLDGVARLSGKTGDITGVEDDFVFLSRQLEGDFIADAKMLGPGGSLGGGAKLGGLMVRQSPLVDARHGMMSVSYMPDAYHAATRPIEGEDTSELQQPLTGSFPRYLAISRSGGSVTAWYADDGVTQVSLGSELSVGLVDPVFLGVPFANISGGVGWIDIDWLRVRRASSEDASASLGAEQSL